MLEYMKFKRGSFKKYIIIELHINNKCISCSLSSVPFDEHFSYEFKISEKKSCKFLESLYRINIPDWNREYTGDKIIENGQWSIEYKEEDSDIVSINGNNSCPPDFSRLLELLDNIAPQAMLIPENYISSFRLKYYHSENSETYETISLKRISKCIVYKKFRNSDIEFCCKYYIRNTTDKFLNIVSMYFDNCFPKENSSDLHNSPVLSVSISYPKREKFKAKRTYNRRGMPENWDSFIKFLFNAMLIQNLSGDIFDSNIFGHGVKDNEYIYCSVKFNEHSDTYYYRTDDDSLKAGDIVIVPCGNDGKTNIAVILKTEYFTKDNVPFPLEKTKIIIGKVN
jgi:hypothetical protein